MTVTNIHSDLTSNSSFGMCIDYFIRDSGVQYLRKSFSLHLELKLQPKYHYGCSTTTICTLPWSAGNHRISITVRSAMPSYSSILHLLPVVQDTIFLLYKYTYIHVVLLPHNRPQQLVWECDISMSWQFCLVLWDSDKLVFKATLMALHKSGADSASMYYYTERKP